MLFAVKFLTAFDVRLELWANHGPDPFVYELLRLYRQYNSSVILPLKGNLVLANILRVISTFFFRQFVTDVDDIGGR